MTVSVILCSYNHAPYLHRRIDSILEQTFKDYELIIIDDHSPDNSDEIIREYTKKADITYIRNSVNSGTPFSSWIKGASIAKGEYIWICESDDFAERPFLLRGMEALSSEPDAVLFYSNSNVVDENDRVIGSTAEYFDTIWENPRWREPFVADGMSELSDYQLYGQTVPNMSSSIIRKDAFQKSCKEYLKKFMLTGDWLFVGLVMQYGKVIFTPETLSNFRKHSNTARVRVKSDMSQAEFILTKYYLHRVLKRKDSELLPMLAKDAIRHIYEDVSGKAVLEKMFRISATDTLSISFKVAVQLLLHREYYHKYAERKEMAHKNQ